MCDSVCVCFHGPGRTVCSYAILIFLGSGMSVDLLPGCSLSGDPVQKSAISETTAQRLALCNSFCINRVRSQCT